MISVVLTCHNSGPYLEQALDSIWNQTYRDWELVAVDDGSQNDTLARLNAFQSRDPERIHVFHRESTGSPSAAKNFGIVRSRGEYIYVLDHDDFISSGLLGNGAERIAETDADAVLPDCITFEDKTGRIVSRQIGLHGDRSAVLTGREAVHWSIDWTIHAFAFWRADLLKEILFNEDTVNGDELSARELFCRCRKVAFCSGELRYRHLPVSITFAAHFSEKTFDPYRMACQLFDFLKENDFPMEDLCLQQYRTFCALRYAYRRYFFHRKNKTLPEDLTSEKVFSEGFAALDRSMIWKYLSRQKFSLHVLLDRLTAARFSLFRSFAKMMKCA